MNEIIKITEQKIGEGAVQTVNARDLHSFLGVGKVFGAWITERIEQFQFAQGVDFEVFSETGNNPSGGRPTKEYALTLDMAKELAMVERNAKGKQARQYFIECERRAKAGPSNIHEALSDPTWLRQTLTHYTEKVIALEAVNKEMVPKVAALDLLATADGSLTLTETAKALQRQPRATNKYLEQNGWIYRRAGSGHYLGYQSKVQAGLLEHKVTTVTRQDGSEKITEQVRVTPKGLTKLAETFSAPTQH